MELGPLSYLLGTRIHTKFHVTNTGIVSVERLHNNLELPIRSPPRDTWQTELSTAFQSLLQCNDRTRTEGTGELVPVKTLVNVSCHRPMLLAFWVLNRAFDRQIPTQGPCTFTRYPIIRLERPITEATYRTIVQNMNNPDPRIRDLVTHDMIDLRRIYEDLTERYMKERDAFTLHCM